jgi:Family of unknown function (DUF5681)
VPKFEKGKSGNPGGRPKALREVEALAQTYTTDAIETLAKIYQHAKTPAAARVAAINSILDRAWGKARQGIDLGGDPENPVRHKIEVRFVKAPNT